MDIEQEEEPNFGHMRLVCSECGASKLVTGYPVLPDGRVASKCLECIRSQQATENLRRRELIANAAMNRYQGALRSAQSKSPRLNDILVHIMDAFDTPKGFVTRYMDQLSKAEQTHPGSKNVLDAYKSLLQMVHANEATLPPPLDLASLTDNELERMIKHEVQSGLLTLEQEILDEDADNAGMSL